MITEVLRVVVDPTWIPSGSLPVAPAAAVSAAASPEHHAIRDTTDDLAYSDGRQGRCAVCAAPLRGGRVYCSREHFRLALSKIARDRRPRREARQVLYHLTGDVFHQNEIQPWATATEESLDLTPADLRELGY